MDSSNSSVSLSGSTLTVKINSVEKSLTNTWRGMQNNLTTSSSDTSDSLSAYQGYLLANGSARDDTKVAKVGDTMSGSLCVYYSGAHVSVGTSASARISFHWAADNNRGLWDGTSNKWVVRHDGSNTYLSGGRVNITGSTSNGSKYVGLSVGGGHLYLNGQNANSSTGGATQLVFANNDGEHVAVSSNAGILIVNPTTDSTTGHICLGVNGCNTSFEGSGKFGIGVGYSSISYKLHVAGDIYATGDVTAASDVNLKNIVGNAGLSVEQIANAPAVKFTWKNKQDELIHAGTIAQYWQKVLPEVVSDKAGTLSMNYGTAAMVATISVAKKVVNHEDRIRELEKENKRLRMELAQLKSA